MKKLLLSLSVTFFASQAFSQVIFKVLEPASIAARYNHSNNGTGSSWGLANLNDPADAVLDTVVVADDGTPGVNAQGNPASATGCTGFAPDQYKGKIVLMFRGDGGTPGIGACAFGIKAQNAQNAGAVAVIIVNREEVVQNMTGGAEGMTVTIPVVGVPLSTGKAILQRLQAGDVVRAFIGTKAGFFANDLANMRTRALRPNFGSKPRNLVKDSTDLRIPVGSWVFNIGTADQVGATFNAKVTRNGTNVVYNKTITLPNIPAGDSVFATLPDIALADYAVGTYSLDYLLATATPDEDDFDNLLSARFDISDSLYSMAQLQDDAKIMRSTTNSTPSPPANSLKLCIAFQEENAEHMFANGIYFRGLVTNAPKTLTGIEIEGGLYEWSDVFTNAGDATFDQINVLDVANYTYASNRQDSSVYFQFAEPIALQSNQRYLACVNKTSTDTVFFAYDGDAHYSTNVDTLLNISVVQNNGTNWFFGFAGTGVIAPAIALNMTVNDAAIKEEKAVTSLAYPNPANEMLTVMVNGSGNAALTITDLSGRVVANDNIKVSNGIFKTNVSTMNSGTYIFNVVFENGTKSQFKVAVAK